MLKDNRYYYEDQYMYFSFDGVHSSEYNLFMINSAQMTMENNAGESAEFVSAMFQEGVYYTGTKKTQKTFKRKCAAEGLSLSQYKRMMKWLTTGEQGMLSFDSNPYWGWNVVLTNVSDTSYALNNTDMVVELELTFKTIGNYLARNTVPATYTITPPSSSSDNDIQSSSCNQLYNSSMLSNIYGIPAIYVVDATHNDNYYTYKISVQSLCNQYQGVNLFNTTHCPEYENTAYKCYLKLQFLDNEIFEIKSSEKLCVYY